MTHARILVTAVGAAIVLGACGNDDGSDAATTTSEPSTTTTGQPTRTVAPTTTTERPDLDDLREDFDDPAIPGWEACLRVEAAVDGIDDAGPPELVASNLEIAAGAATQDGHDDLAADLTAVAADLRAYGFTAPSARILAEIELDCGLA